MEGERKQKSRPLRERYKSLGTRATEIGSAGVNTPHGATSSSGGVHDGRSIGVYGRSKYGRCVYGAKRGVYGVDKYGLATYGGVPDSIQDARIWAIMLGV